MIDTAVELIISVVNLVDPSCIGNRLSAEQENQGEMWLQMVTRIFNLPFILIFQGKRTSCFLKIFITKIELVQRYSFKVMFLNGKKYTEVWNIVT